MTEYEQYVLQLLMSIYWELVKVPDPKQTPRNIALIAEVQDFIKRTTRPGSPAPEER